VTAQRLRQLFVIATIGLAWAWPAPAADETLPDSDVLMRALADELNRSMKLQMEDLEQPYFIQFNVDDTLSYQLSAEYGALTASDRDRSRDFQCEVRVGSLGLDNTNFADSMSFIFGGRDGGGRASLPTDDDYVAIRQAIWRATDDDYKDAVETLTKKKAYMRDKNIVDRPDDFSAAEPVELVEPSAVLHFDRAEWEDNLKRISGHFKKYEPVQESGARLYVGAGNTYVVNSEGTRLRVADNGVLLLVTAQVQADDGMRLSDSRSYAGETVADFPPVEKILSDVDEMVAELTAVMKAPVIEYYTGPVLFDDVSAAQMFQTTLAAGLAGKPDPVGEQRRRFEGAESLENKLGTRILPRPFQVWDDPTVKKHGDEVLLGHYRYDDEGVAARRVELVADGKLESLCMSRAPVRKLSGSNGHARRAQGAGAPQAAVGCLFIADDQGVPNGDLKAALIEAAQDAGLEYGVRIKSIRSPGITSSRSDLISMIMRARRGSVGGLGDPVIAYKVYVQDGHEEPFRGGEFGPFDVTELKRIAAAGDTPKVYNYIGMGLGGATPPSSIIAPPVLFEDLELTKIQQEHDKQPILEAPAFR
jgi:TldD protein